MSWKKSLSTKQTTRKRSPFIQNIFRFCLFLVVMGHVCECVIVSVCSLLQQTNRELKSVRDQRSNWIRRTRNSQTDRLTELEREATVPCTLFNLRQTISLQVANNNNGHLAFHLQWASNKTPTFSFQLFNDISGTLWGSQTITEETWTSFLCVCSEQIFFVFTKHF